MLAAKGQNMSGSNIWFGAVLINKISPNILKIVILLFKIKNDIT